MTLVFSNSNFGFPFLIHRQTDLNPSSPVIIVRGGSQGNDLGPITDEDSEALVEAKRTISEIITQWVRGV